MTIAPGADAPVQVAPAARPHYGASEAPTTRQDIRYAFFKARPSWLELDPARRDQARSALLATLEPFTERLVVLRAFSTLGTRADADFVLWQVSERLEDFTRLLDA